MIREIVRIDEALCDGCGLCVPTCHEGAIKIVNGKARLVSDRYCDGLGACLGHCPQDAIRVERREATAFDEAAVEQHLKSGQSGASSSPAKPLPVVSSPGSVPQPVAMARGCPSSRLTQFKPRQHPTDGSADRNPDLSEKAPVSELTHWPIQLRLVPPGAPVFSGTHLLLTADCAPVAMADFHQEMLKGKTLAMACPKLDNPDGYLEKLTEIIRTSELTGLTVAHMEVPCCTGLLMLAIEARQQSGVDVPLFDVVVSIQGDVIANREIPIEAVA